MSKSFRFSDGRDWFLDARFGLFIHRGIYAIPQGENSHPR
jgi:hypothetical protein